jgi:uncharacterized protein YeaO (DUF488 family)
MAGSLDIQVKRVQQPASADDGRRVLIDRLWPRGVSKDGAQLDEWLRELAPSDELRRWFDHRPERFQEFRRRYTAELGDQRSALSRLRRTAREGRLTILYGARDTEHNNAVVLASVLRAGLR